jgi:hypothetical protein
MKGRAFAVVVVVLSALAGLPAAAEDSLERRQVSLRDESRLVPLQGELVSGPLASTPSESRVAADARATMPHNSAMPRAQIRRGSKVGKVANVVLAALAGGMTGFFAGGLIGSAIERPFCNCDDPGLRGFIIGAPTGAVLGSAIAAAVAAK